MSSKWELTVTAEGRVDQGTGPDPATLQIEEETDQ